MHRYQLPAVSANYPPTREDEGLINGETVFDGDEELSGVEEGEIIPYAHRDIKPA
jgi:serine/threonine kinase 16